MNSKNWRSLKEANGRDKRDKNKNEKKKQKSKEWKETENRTKSVRHRLRELYNKV